MRTGFEEWLEEQGYEPEVNDLFKESIICYKASAYRAALLFSFLGFQTIIKHRVINSKPANNYSDGEWDQLKMDLSDDDKWDRKVIDIIQNKKKPIFNVSEDLREQYSFWKNRRNDCAHAKGNIISLPHVEGFWLFIKSNLAKFVVIGGRKFVLQEIANYFNPARTPIETPIEPIIEQIPSAIEKSDINQFLDQLKDFTSPQSILAYKMFDENVANMWYKLFDLPDSYGDYIANFLVKDPSFCLKIIRRKPEIIQYFYNKDTFIRMLWKKDFSIPEDYRVFISLLRHGLIPKSQLNEAFDHIFNTLDTTLFDKNTWWVEDEEIIDGLDNFVLMQYKFFTCFNSLAFEEEEIANDFNWANKNKELTVYYIKHFGLNKTIVTAINKAMTSAYPPFRLRDMLEGFYKQNQDQLAKHIEISEGSSPTVPKVPRMLSELQDE